MLAQTMKRKDNELFYCAEWDMYGITKNEGDYTFLITNDDAGSQKFYRVLTDRWDYVCDI